MKFEVWVQLAALVTLNLLLAAAAIAFLCRVQIRESVAWCGFMIFSGAVFAFGVSNANSHCYPTYPDVTGDSDKMLRRLARYEKQLAEVGQDAAVPVVYCFPLILSGLVGSVVGCIYATDAYGRGK